MHRMPSRIKVRRGSRSIRDGIVGRARPSGPGPTASTIRRLLPGGPMARPSVIIRPLTLVGALGALACARPPATGPAPAVLRAGPSQTYVDPEPGERHLRRIRQLTFGGNNAEAYFSPDGQRLIFQHQDSL